MRQILIISFTPIFGCIFFFLSCKPDTILSRINLLRFVFFQHANFACICKHVKQSARTESWWRKDWATKSKCAYQTTTSSLSAFIARIEWNMVIYGNNHELDFFFTDDKLLLHIYVFIDSKSFGFNWYELTYVLELNINLETHMSSMQVIWTIYNNRNKYRINPWFCWKAYHSTDIQLSISIPFTFFFSFFTTEEKLSLSITLFSLCIQC